MCKKVVIIGAGGYAKVIADIVRESGDELVGFLDDAYSSKIEFYGSYIFGKTEKIKDFSNCYFIIAIGNNKIREKIAREHQSLNWYTAVHPSAQISTSAQIGAGSAVMPMAVINADAQIGEHAIINTGAIVEHDCKIGSYTHISPRAAVCGLVTVGNGTWIGAGATVKNVLSICQDVTVGLGASVIRNITEPGTYVGVPAKKI